VIENPDGTATAEPSDSIRLVAIGTLIHLGQVTAHAKVAVASDGKVTKSSELVVGSLTVAGIQVGLTDKGLVLAGSTLLSAAPIQHLLAAAHVGLTYLPKAETNTSIRSAGLAVTYTTNVPGQGPVTVTVTYGQVSAAAESTPQSPATDVMPSTPGSAPSSTGVNAGATPTGASITAPLAPVAAGSSSLTPRSPAIPALAAGRVQPRRAIAGSRLVGLMPSGKTFYILLVAAGLLAVGGSRLLGELAIRLRMGGTHAD
jgi:hypothetical protein